MSESSIQLSVSRAPYNGSPVPPSAMGSSFIPLSTIGTDLISVSNWNQDLRAEERQVDKGVGNQRKRMRVPLGRHMTRMSRKWKDVRQSENNFWATLSLWQNVSLLKAPTIVLYEWIQGQCHPHSPSFIERRTRTDCDCSSFQGICSELWIDYGCFWSVVVIGLSRHRGSSISWWSSSSTTHSPCRWIVMWCDPCVQWISVTQAILPSKCRFRD